MMKAEEKMVVIGDISLMSGRNSAQAIVLKESAEADRQLTIFVGPAEFSAIAKEKGLAKSSRPLTHELYLGIMEKLPVEFLRVEIFSLKQDTYYARVLLRFDGEEYSTDSRPSDAIALSLNRKIPVMVSKHLLRPFISQKDMKEYKQFIKRATI